MTEPEYLDGIKRLHDSSVVRVDSRHGKPSEVVRWAIEFKKVQDRDARREGLPPEERPEVWCIFDRDEHPGVDQLIEMGRRAGVGIAFSHPCFEFWLLLHFLDHGAPAGGDGSSICRRLVSYLSSGKHVDVVDLRGRYALARDRAQRLARQHDRDAAALPTQRDPSTNVWELVDRLGVTY